MAARAFLKRFQTSGNVDYKNAKEERRKENVIISVVENQAKQAIVMKILLYIYNRLK